MQLASQSDPADLLGIVTPVSSRGNREFTKSKDRKNGRRAAQKGEVTCDELPRRCSTRECRDASWGADEVSAPQFCWHKLRASQLCWRLNRPRGALSWPGVVEGFAFGWPEFGCGVTSGLTGCTEG